MTAPAFRKIGCLLCIIVFFVMVLCGCPDREMAPGAVKGVLYLSGWDFEKNGTAMPPRGVATYRLTVRVEPDPSRLALMIGRPLSVAKVWVNGRLLGRTRTSSCCG